MPVKIWDNGYPKSKSVIAVGPLEMWAYNDEPDDESVSAEGAIKPVTTMRAVITGVPPMLHRI